MACVLVNYFYGAYLANLHNSVTLLVYMSTDKKTPSQPESSTENQLLIVGTFFDTTWRMFIPILVTSLIGYGIDKMAHTRPIGVLVGMTIGIFISIALVIMQYKSIKRSGK